MATSHHAFLVELYQEYLSEASFLYERRRNSIREPECSWMDLVAVENRLEAHLDGLMVGAQLALDVCREQAAKGDFGELYAAVCVFCRHRRMDLVQAVFEQLDSEDVEKIEATADAIKHEAPSEWRGELVRLFRAGAEPKKLKVLARVLGWRRWEATMELSAALNRNDRACVAEILWASGRSKTVSRTSVPFELLNDAEEGVCFAASLALLRRGESQVLRLLLRKPALSAWACLSIALAGGKSAAEFLVDRACGVNADSKAKIPPDVLIALGLLGMPSAVPCLIAQLAIPELAPTAAMALRTITAATLWEKVFIPERVDEDELFDYEKEHREIGAIALRSDGKPFGSNEHRLSLDPHKWNKWWSTNSPEYNAALCYRYGELMSPNRALDCLESAETPNRVRALMVEEMAIRYCCDVPLEADMSVAKQKQALAKIREWVNATRPRFQPGAWYFNGKLTT